MGLQQQWRPPIGRHVKLPPTQLAPNITVINPITQPERLNVRLVIIRHLNRPLVGLWWFWAIVARKWWWIWFWRWRWRFFDRRYRRRLIREPFIQWILFRQQWWRRSWHFQPQGTVDHQTQIGRVILRKCAGRGILLKDHCGTQDQQDWSQPSLQPQILPATLQLPPKGTWKQTEDTDQKSARTIWRKKSRRMHGFTVGLPRRYRYQIVPSYRVESGLPLRLVPESATHERGRPLQDVYRLAWRSQPHQEKEKRCHS